MAANKKAEKQKTTARTSSHSTSSRSKKNSSGSGTRSGKTGTPSRRASSSGSSRQSAAVQPKSGTKKARTRRAASRREDHFSDGIIVLVVLVFCVLLLVSAFGNGGFIGRALCSVEFGLFGRLAYFFPLVLFLCVAFAVSNRMRAHTVKKLLSAAGLYAFLCGFIHIVTEGYQSSRLLTDYYALGADYHIGGGLVGGAVCITTHTAFGKIGGMIVIILAMVVFVILLTQRSMTDFIFAITESISAGMEERRLRREEAEAEEMDMDMDPDEDGSNEALLSSRRRDNKRKSLPDRDQQADADALTPEDFDAGQERRMRRRLKEAKRANRKEEKRQRRIRELEEALAKEMGRPLYQADQPAEEKRGFSFDPSGLDLKAGMTLSDTYKEPVLRIPNGGTGTDADAAGFHADAAAGTAGVTGRLEIHRMDQTDEDDDPYAGTQADPFASAALARDMAEAANPLNTSTAALPEDGTTFRKADNAAGKKKARRSADELEADTEQIIQEIEKKEEEPPRPYEFPPLDLLKKGSKGASGQSNEEIRATAARLQEILGNFGVNVTVTDVSCGPTVTRYELQPEPGVKVSRIVNLADDIKLNLAAADIRIEAPIPGKAAVGIEVPNKESVPVMLRDLLSSQEFQNAKSRISFAVGKDIAGKPIVTDIARMPHLLIAGATGAGKSVCINTLIVSILYKAKPDEVQLIMIDPKVVELSVYNGIPHLLIPVVTDPKKASGALNWAVTEMTRRYNLFAEHGVRNIGEYNRKLDQTAYGPSEERPPRMSQIVIIVDELADLMMVAPGEVEEAICRLAQLARAAGLHLVIATQRPSVNVITGLIKANMPSRIAFAVSSGVDSRTILDTYGAEKLLGKGDMLFSPQGYPKPARLQGAFVSDDEISDIVAFLKERIPAREYDRSVQEHVDTVSLSTGKGGSLLSAAQDDEHDVYFADAGRCIIEKDRAAIGTLQRALKIGFNRASRIMDQLAEAGVVGPEEGTKPRKVLMSMEQFENYLEENG